MRISHYRDMAPDTEVPGVALRTVVGENDGALPFAMRVFEVKPGASTPFHSHPWEHAVYVLSGKGEVEGPQSATPLEPGSVAFIPSQERHHFTNMGERPFCFVCVIPTQGKDNPKCDV
ncbi:MAG: cupin domain-containing protein [Chloroflexi bacterium]|nr:cupin domain-containing protein [Chloroflexota bacterium]